MQKNMKVAVALGGDSREREISLKTGQAVAQGLRQRGFSNLHEIDTKDHPEFYKQAWDAVFVALHGPGGEDGSLQCELEQRNISFTGSGSKSSKLAMSKYDSKCVFQQNKIPTLPFFRTDDLWDVLKVQGLVAEHLTYPIIAKPDQEGSSIGLEIVQDPSQLPGALKRLQNVCSVVLWENYLEDGVDLTVGILDGQPLPVIEIRPKQGWYDYDAKYTQGMTEYICPARIDTAFAKQVQSLAVKAFEALGCRSWGRVDFMWKGSDLYCLEVNTVPGMTPTSLVPMAAQETDISFEALVERILIDVQP